MIGLDSILQWIQKEYESSQGIQPLTFPEQHQQGKEKDCISVLALLPRIRKHRLRNPKTG